MKHNQYMIKVQNVFDQIYIIAFKLIIDIGYWHIDISDTKQISQRSVAELIYY